MDQSKSDKLDFLALEEVWMLKEAQQFNLCCYQACEFGDVISADADAQLRSETAC